MNGAEHDDVGSSEMVFLRVSRSLHHLLATPGELCPAHLRTRPAFDVRELSLAAATGGGLVVRTPLGGTQRLFAAIDPLGTPFRRRTRLPVRYAAGRPVVLQCGYVSMLPVSNNIMPALAF